MKVLYKCAQWFGGILWVIGKKLASFGDGLVSAPANRAICRLIDENGNLLSDEDQVDIYFDLPVPGKWRVRIGPNIAIFGDYLALEIGRKISFWSYGKLNNDCLANVPESYLYGATDILPSTPPSPWVKTGCEAQDGVFRRVDCAEEEK